MRLTLGFALLSVLFHSILAGTGVLERVIPTGSKIKPHGAAIIIHVNGKVAGLRQLRVTTTTPDGQELIDTMAFPAEVPRTDLLLPRRQVLHAPVGVSGRANVLVEAIGSDPKAPPLASSRAEEVAFESGRSVDIDVCFDCESTAVSMMSNREVEDLTKQIDAETEKKLAEAKKSDENPDADGQVVDLPRPTVEIRPDEAKFLSEYDSAAKKQTKARSAPAEDAGKPSPQVQRTPPPRPGARSDSSAPRGTGTGQRVPGVAGGAATDTRPDGFDGPGTADGTLPRKGDPGLGETEGNGDGRPLPKLGDLRPQDDTLQRAAGGGGVSDYLKDVEEGAETVLSSKRWKFASFFNRMKNQVAQHWHPDVAYRLRDPSGKIYGTRNRLTVLRVTLSPEGSLKDVFLEKSCEVGFLDDEAESAFRAAEPFPNPPQQLVSADTGVISFRFGFLFEITSSPKFRVFRYSD